MTRPVLVLDSGPFRYADTERVRALWLAGYDLRVSILALAETWATALRQLDDPKHAKDPEAGLRRLGAAARRLNRYADQPTSIEPGLDFYVLDARGPRPDDGDATPDAYRDEYAGMWDLVTAPDFDRGKLEQGRVVVDRIRSIRDRWKHFCSFAEIWRTGEALGRFRGEAWMKEPCATCDKRHLDFGGCRCQALALAGDAAATDPACSLAPRHDLIEDAVRAADAPETGERRYLFRGFPAAR